MTIRRILGTCMTAAVLWLGLPAGVWAAPGDIAGFDFTRDSGGDDEEPLDVAVGASGKIYVLNRLDTFEYLLQRFNTDGTVDVGFGTAGAIAFDAADSIFSDLEGFFALAIDEANGSALIGGTAASGFSSSPQFAVKRLRFVGGFDPEFGSGGRTRINTPRDGVILRMALDAGGRIVLAGVDASIDIQDVSIDDASPFIARLTADGDVDPGFTQTLLDWGGDNDAPAGVYVEGSGTILVSGAASLNDALEFGERSALSRLSANGGLDGSFGNSGTFVEDFEPGICEDDNKLGCEGAAIYRPLPGGQFLMTVYIDRSGGGPADEIQITRFNTNGTPDASFGPGGFRRFPSAAFIPGSVPALLPDDRVVLAKDQNVGGGSDEDLRLYLIEGYSRIISGGGNTAPVAVDDRFRIAEDSVQVALRVLNNDTDADGDRLRILRVIGGASIGGTAAPDARGRTLLYTPAPDFVGTGTFSYIVIDRRGGSARASVTVTVRNANNDPPVAVDDSFTLAAVSRFNTLRVQVNDLDPDPRTRLSITRSLGRPANGRVRLTAEGRLQYRPNPGFVGTDTFGYEVSDGMLSDRGTVTVIVGP
ncbi:MAG: Ig-like domain-containing protein [Panacagrimonas sp.]